MRTLHTLLFLVFSTVIFIGFIRHCLWIRFWSAVNKLHTALRQYFVTLLQTHKNTGDWVLTILTEVFKVQNIFSHIILGYEIIILPQVKQLGYTNSLFSPHLLSLFWHAPELSDHPDEEHSNMRGRVFLLHSEPCPSRVTLTTDNLILSWLEKGSGKYKKDISGRSESLHLILWLFSQILLFKVLITGIMDESHR